MAFTLNVGGVGNSISVRGADYENYINVTKVTSGILTPAAGLFDDYDTTPLTQTLVDRPALINGILFESALPITFVFRYDSIGIDLGIARKVEKLFISGYCPLVGYFPPGTIPPYSNYWHTGYDSMSVYKSDDNNTWTLVQSFVKPPFTYLNYITGSSPTTNPWTVQYTFELSLTSKPTARYFKVFATLTWAFTIDSDGGGGTGWPTAGEIQAYGNF